MAKIIALVFGVVVVAAGAYLLLSTPAYSPETDEGTATSETVPREDTSLSSGTGTFADLLALGENITCTFMFEDPEVRNTTEGTVYIAGERVRGDFTAEQDGGMYDFHTIHTDATGYMWGSGPEGNMAYLFPLSKADDQTTTSETYESDPFQSDEQMTYECDRWSVDEGMLTPPSDVTFQDFSAMFMQFDAGQGDVQGAQCAACDQLPADAQVQCREALGC